jgi:ElaB/YqjD/DUF883 family membrane-anchored ribosome-binding protein
MPTTLHQSSGVQNFESGPAQPPDWENYVTTGGTTVLEKRARQLGSSLGRTVAAVRKTQGKLRDTASQAKEAAATQIQGLQRQVKTTYEGARDGAQRVLHEYPVHVVLAAGVVGLLLGMSLRLWRASHES